MQYYNIKSTPVTLGKRRQGTLYEPTEKTPYDHIMVPYHYAPALYAQELAKRGYKAMTLQVGGGPMASANHDDLYMMYREAVEYCRNMEGIDTVLGLNWSGGNSVMTAYQAMAENGVSYFQKDSMLIKISDMPEMLPFEGIITIDSNYGNGMMTLLSLDPAVVDENDGTKLDPELDLFNPANGFVPGGSQYTDEFVKKFQNAQGERMNKIVKYCQDRIALIDQGKGRFTDDEPLVVPGANQVRFYNKLFPQDIRYLGCTTSEFPHMQPDGSIINEVVKTVREPMDGKSGTHSYHQGARVTTVKNFLRECSAWTNNFSYDSTHFYGVDWDCSYSNTLGNAAGISVPVLSCGFTASWEFVGIETLFERIKSIDKSALFVKGAGHLGTPERGTEALYGDTLGRTFDYIANWIGNGERFK